jgi:glycerophosphoryl diester phosphodiesterase
MGCDAVELDVFSLRCGTLVVFHGGGSDEHPGTLEGYVMDKNGNSLHGKTILDFTYEEILQQDWTFNAHNPEFPCPPESIQAATIPTLEQVLLDVKRHKTANNMHVTMELKGGFNLAENVLQLVDKLDMQQQTSCSSFIMEYLRQIRDLRPERDAKTGGYLYQTGALFNDVMVEADGNDIIEAATAVGASEIHLRYDTCTRDLVDKLHNHEFATMAWFRGPVGMAYDAEFQYLDVGNEDESMYEVVGRTGVQKLCVNKPDVLLGLRQKMTQLEKQRSRVMPSSTRNVDSQSPSR